ncbi:MAG: flagellar motor switch protein FliG [Firmicutes bacterium]|nr:flagellar motor switch protein FliG [Bacillota bacterium]
MKARSKVDLTGAQKAAITLISLGTELAARVIKELPEAAIERIGQEISGVGQVKPEVTASVLDEFMESLLAGEYMAKGGVEYARDMLEKALGHPRAQDIIRKMNSSLQLRPFDLARKADPGQLANFLQNEHPQTIALIISHLNPNQASSILASLSLQVQTDVVRRIATMKKTSPEVIQSVEGVLERKISSLLIQDYSSAGGIDAVVQVLNHVDRSTEKGILENLEREDPALTEEIKKKLFVFEDLVLLDDRSLQQALREIDLTKDLPVALKVASDDVKAKIFKNLSQRAGENLRDDMEYLGPVRLREVEEAQQKVVSVIRRLEEEGEILIARGEGDEIIA